MKQMKQRSGFHVGDTVEIVWLSGDTTLGVIREIAGTTNRPFAMIHVITRGADGQPLDEQEYAIPLAKLRLVPRSA